MGSLARKMSCLFKATEYWLRKVTMYLHGRSNSKSNSIEVSKVISYFEISTKRASMISWLPLLAFLHPFLLLKKYSATDCRERCL